MVTILEEVDDEIRGARVVCTARKITRIDEKIRLTGGHRGYRVVLEKNVRCVIERKQALR